MDILVWETLLWWATLISETGFSKKKWQQVWQEELTSEQDFSLETEGMCFSA